MVLERRQQVGGLAGSFEVAQQRVDHGSHRLHAGISPEILQLLRNRLGDELQRRPRRGRIRLQGRWLAFPPGPGELIRSLPPWWLVRAGSSALAASFRPRRDRSFSDFVATGLGRVAGSAFYFPYARKIWGVEPEELSGYQARRRISADTPWKLARRVVGKQNGSGRFFYYPAGGFGRIPEVLADAATESGAEIRLGIGAERIEFADRSVTVTTTGGQRIVADRLWSTIPVTSLVDLAEPVIDDPAPATRALEYRSMLLVYLALATDRYTPYDAHYFPESDVPMTRISEPKNYRRGPDPPGRTVLCAEIPCAPGGDRWGWSSDDLAALVAEALVNCGLRHPRPFEVVVRRIRHAYPVYRIGHERSFASLMEWTDRRKRLVTFGRQGLFAHDNTHHALSMAWTAAGCLDPNGRMDIARWADARRSFEKHVVED